PDGVEGNPGETRQHSTRRPARQKLQDILRSLQTADPAKTSSPTGQHLQAGSSKASGEAPEVRAGPAAILTLRKAGDRRGSRAVSKLAKRSEKGWGEPK